MDKQSKKLRKLKKELRKLFKGTRFEGKVVSDVVSSALITWMNERKREKEIKKAGKPKTKAKVKVSPLAVTTVPVTT